MMEDTILSVTTSLDQQCVKVAAYCTAAEQFRSAIASDVAITYGASSGAIRTYADQSAREGKYDRVNVGFHVYVHFRLENFPKNRHQESLHRD